MAQLPLSKEDLEDIERLYLSGLSMRKVAIEMVIDHWDVFEHIKSLGISRPKGYPKEFTEKAIRLYMKTDKSCREVAEGMGVSKSSIEYWLGKELLARSKSDASSLGQKKRMERYGYINSKEARQKQSQRMKKLVKEGKHHWWRGGISYEWRGDDWDKQRRACYTRDKFKCQSCGIHRSKAILFAHHIVLFRETKDNSLGNLITLCGVCHGKEHGRPKKNGGGTI